MLTISLLNELYIKYNAEFFNNELPIIPFKIGRAKTSAGYVRYRRSRSYGQIKATVLSIDFISISKYYDRPLSDIQDTVIHEMIHIYLLNKGIIETGGGDKHHGTEFLEKAKEINSQSSFEISKTCEVKYTVSNAIIKKRYFVLINKSGNGKSIFKISKKLAFSTILRDRLNAILDINPNMVKMKICCSYNSDLDVYPTKNKLSSLSMYQLTDELHNIENDMTIISSI